MNRTEPRSETAMAQPTTDDPVVEMNELTPYAGAGRIAAVTPGPEMLDLTWDDGARRRFPYVWLRDNCACARCRHPQTRERTFDLLDLPDTLPRPQAELRDDGALRLRWPEAGGSHESLFDPGWLRRFAPGARAGGTAEDRQPWTAADLGDGPPRVAHDEAMGTDAGLRRWLRLLTRTGAALLDDGPAADQEVLRVAARVGWPRETNFGRMFDVVSKPNPNNAAYTAIKLEPHVDLPNWQRPPDFQFLYCLENAASGGASTLVDGFAVAEALRTEDPDAFELLATQPVDFRFQDETSEIAFRAPTIGRDADGRLAEIRFNNWIRDAQDMPAERIAPFYRAYRRFWALLRDPRFMIRFTLKPGQMLAFDNLRVLHGRDSFDPNTGRRHLQGCYLDRDLVSSRLAVLERARDSD